MWLCFVFLHTRRIFCSRLMLGSSDLFNTTTKLEDHYFRDRGGEFGLAPQHFLPIYLEARRKAYSLANIESAFRITGIVPLNSRILTNPPSRVEAQGEVESVLLERTPYTKCQLRQPTNAALTFVKIATPGKVYNHILRFSHSVEQSFTTAEIADSEASRLRTQLKEGASQEGKKRRDRKVVSKARALTVGEGIAMVEEMDQSAGRTSLRRPPVTRTSGSGSLAVHATPRRARVRFEAAVTPLFSKSASPANLHSHLHHQCREPGQRPTYRSHMRCPPHH